MILHPGAHFGDFPHPIDGKGSRGCPPWSHAQSRAGSRAPLRLFPEPSPLARADFASSPPRRSPAPRAFHGRRGPRTRRGPSRRTRGRGWGEGGQGGKIGRLARRRGCWNLEGFIWSILRPSRRGKLSQLRRLYLNSPFLSPLFLPPSLLLALSLSLVFFLLLSFLALGEPVDFLRKISASRYWILMRSTFRFCIRITKYFITKYFCTQNSARFLYTTIRSDKILGMCYSLIFKRLFYYI